MYLLIEMSIKTKGLTFEVFVDWEVEKMSKSGLSDTHSVARAISYRAPSGHPPASRTGRVEAGATTCFESVPYPGRGRRRQNTARRRQLRSVPSLKDKPLAYLFL